MDEGRTAPVRGVVSQMESGAAPFWRGLVRCPGCRGTMDGLDRCGACGLAFGAEQGRPRLMHRGLSGEARLRHRAAAISEAELKALVRDPAAGGAGRGARGNEGLPYHVDRAHAEAVAALPRGRRVLEIGCGGGQCRPWFRGLGHEYVGVDVSVTRVHDWLREFGGPDLLCDAHFLPFADQSFDVVYCAAVTEHLACPALAAAEALRVLRPGGLFLGNVSFLELWHDRSYFHMSPLGVISLLRGTGFEVVAVWPGRGYSGFRAMHTMGFHSVFRPMRLVGRVSEAAYGVQLMVQRIARRARGKPPIEAVLQRARVAGATDWIARRPRLTITVAPAAAGLTDAVTGESAAGRA